MKTKWEKINEINISKEWHVSFMQLYTNSSVLYNFFLRLMKYMINSRCDEMNRTTECRTYVWLSFSATKLDFNTLDEWASHRQISYMYSNLKTIRSCYILTRFSLSFAPKSVIPRISNVFVCLCHVSWFVVAIININKSFRHIVICNENQRPQYPQKRTCIVLDR